MGESHADVAWWPDAGVMNDPAIVDALPVPGDLEIVAEGLGFPEGPIWCADGTLLVVEVRTGRLSRVKASGSVEVVADLGGGPNGAAIGADGLVYVCNNGGLPWTQRPDDSWYPVDAATGSMTPPGYSSGWIERVDPRTGTAERILSDVGGAALSAPNDIAFDRAGTAWITDTGKTGVDSTKLGGIIRLDRHGGAELFARGLLGPNGIGLAENGTVLCMADTPTGRVLAWDLEGRGASPAPRLRGQFPGLVALDSLAVDAEDRVIVAMPGAGALGIVEPSGATWRLAVPDPLPTNACFGGPDGRTLFVTLGGHGRIARLRWPCAGAPLAFSC